MSTDPVKKILAVNFFPAFTPPGSGGELRYYHIYRYLRRHYDITMVNPSRLFSEPETEKHFPNMVEHRVPKNKIHYYLHRIFGFLGNFSECSAVVVMAASRLEKTLKAKVNQFLPEADIVIHECPFLINLTPRVRDKILVYNSYNVEYDLQKDMLKGVLGIWLCRMVKKAEKKACRMADLVLATSENDKKRFVDLYGISPRKIVLVPNGVDPAEIKPPNEEERNRARQKLEFGDALTLLFFGSAHPPNVRAANFINEQIAPVFPGVNFVMAGKVCESIEKDCSPNLRLLGIVSDEDKIHLLKGADIAINPMFSGSGTNLKMFDYLSAGLPVITTPVGARGIPVVHGKEAMIADPDYFADSINDLIHHPEQRLTLSKYGRKLVETDFNWKNLSERIHEAFKNLGKPSVTVVNDFHIVPPRHGGQYRIHSLYNELSRFIPVYYVCMQKESDDLELTEINPDFIQMAAPKTFFHRVSESLLARLLKQTLDDLLAVIFAHHNPVIKREIRQAARFNDYLISSHPYLWKTISKYRDNVRIYESLNYETVLKKFNLKGCWSPLGVYLVNHIEGKAIKESDSVLTVSDEEQTVLARDFKVEDKYITIPNGTGVSGVRIPEKKEKKKLREYLGLSDYPIALFIGSAHPPNVEAGTHIVRGIAPKVPEVLFFVVGSVCWLLKDIPERKDNVKLFFEVDEEIRNDLFRVADLAVNPMITGAGTSLKMFDFLAAGLPVVTTSIGARGVKDEKGQFTVICEVEKFPEEIRNLTESPEKMDIMRKKGRKYVEENFDWGVIAGKLHHHLISLGGNVAPRDEKFPAPQKIS